MVFTATVGSPRPSFWKTLVRFIAPPLPSGAGGAAREQLDSGGAGIHPLDQLVRCVGLPAVLADRRLQYGANRRAPRVGDVGAPGADEQEFVMPADVEA